LGSAKAGEETEFDFGQAHFRGGGVGADSVIAPKGCGVVLRNETICLMFDLVDVERWEFQVFTSKSPRRH
jgi:hypothetical protein